MESQKSENANENKVNPVYGKIVLSLENCLLPQEKLENPPSVVDGLDPETECDLRIIGCELIQTAGILLKLPQVAMATGQVLFQRFYYCKSFVRHPMDVTAMGCVCLASKIEEAPRRIRDVINVFHHTRQVRCQKPITPLTLDQQYSALKTQIIKAERRILKELGFCVHVKHPHKLIVCYLQVLTLEKNGAVMQTAWNYMNDSLRTNVFLQYSPETVACACIYLTARKLKVALPKNTDWYSLFDVKEEDILDICKRIVQLYSRPKIDPDVLESKVETLRKSYEECREKIRSSVTASGSNTPNNITSPQRKSKTPSPPSKTITNNVKRSRSRLRSESPKITKNKKYSSRKDSCSRSRSRSRTPERHKSKNSSYKSRRGIHPQSPISPYEYSSKKSKSKRVRDYKIVNSDTDEEYAPRSRSNNGNYWKKFYSYA